MNEDNPTKRYYVQLPGYERGELWDEDKYNRNRDALFNDHTDAVVFETSPLAQDEEISNDSIYTVHLPGYPQAESWDGEKMKRNREQLMKEHPDVEITSARPINYWGDKLGEIYGRINELNKELEGISDEDAKEAMFGGSSPRTIPGSSLADAQKNIEAEREKPERKRRKEIERELNQLYEMRESNPAFINYMKYLDQSIDDDYSRIDSMMKKQREKKPESAENYDYARAGGMPGMGGGAIDPFAINAAKEDPAFNKNMESLAAAKVMLDDAKKTATAPTRYGDENGFWRAIAESAPESLAPAKLTKLGLNMHLIDAVKKIQNSETTGEKTDIMKLVQSGQIDKLGYLSDGEKELVKAFVKKAEVEGAMSEKIGDNTRSRIAKSYQAGQSFGESIGFMTDFMLYGGAGEAAADAVAGGLVKKAGRAALKKIGAETLYGGVKALAMTPLMPSSYYQLQQDLLQFDDAGGVDLSGKAIRKAVGDVVIENISETIGSKPLELIALPLEKVNFPGWAKAMRHSPIFNTMKQAGYNGLFEEIVEEWTGNAMRVMTGVDKDALKDFATVEQQLITLGSFAPMSLFSAPMTAVQYHAASKSMREAGATLEEVMRHSGMSDETIRAAMNIDDLGTPEEFGAHMANVYRQMVDNGAKPEAAYRAVMNYTESASQYKVMTGVMDEQNDIERSKRLLEIDSQVGSENWHHTGNNGASFVRTITDKDGNEMFVVGTDEQGTMSLVDRNGKKSFMTAGVYQQDVENGTITDSGEVFLSDYLDRENQAQKKSAEAERITTETADKTKALLDNLQPDMVINIGSVENPQNAVVRQVSGGRVVLETPDGRNVDYSLEDVANMLGVDIKAKTDAEIEDKGADAIIEQKEKRRLVDDISKTAASIRFGNRDYIINAVQGWEEVNDGQGPRLRVVATPVTLAEGEGQENLMLSMEDVDNYISSNQDKLNAEEKLEEVNEKIVETEDKQTEDNTPRDFRGNPLPLRENKVTGETVVDGTTLWNNDPMAWAVWNDSNPNRRTTSKEKLEYNINELAKEIKKDTEAIRKAALKGISEDDMDVMESELAKKVNRLKLLQDTLAQISMPAAAAETVAGAERKAAAEKAKQKQQAGFPAIKEKWDNAPKIVGAEDEIRLANGETISGSYVLTEATAPTPSHNPQDGFKKSEGFPVDENGKTVNDRDYERDKAAQKAVLDKAANYDQRALQTPVIVSNEGVVLSGNDRTMSSQLAAINGTDKAYVDYLTKYAQKYGFTEGQVKSMQHPRVVFVPDAAMSYDAATFSKFNAEEKKSQNKTESAVKAGKTISANALGKLAALVNGYEDINALYNDENGADALINIMLEDGYITPEQVAAFKEGNRLSGTGIDFLESTLIGSSLEEEAVRIVMEDRSMRHSIVSAIAQIIENSTIEGYNLRAELTDAIALVAKGKASKTIKFGDSVQGYIRQGNLFGDDVVAEATVQLLADALNSKKTTLLKKVLSLYNRDAIDSANGQMDLWAGSVATKDDILKQILNNLGYDIRTFNTFKRAEAARQGKDTGGAESGEAGTPVQGESGSVRQLTPEEKLEEARKEAAAQKAANDAARTKLAEKWSKPLTDKQVESAKKRVEKDISKLDNLSDENVVEICGALSNIAHNQRYGIELTPEQQEAVNRANEWLSSNGYSMDDMVGKDYHNGMIVEPDFTIDETLPDGAAIITSASSPAIYKDGKLIKAAKVHVTQALYESAEERLEDEQRKREYANAYMIQLNVDSAIIDQMTDEEIDEFLKLYEEFEPFNDAVGEAYTELDADLNSKDKKVKAAAQAKIDQLEQEEQEAFQPLQQFVDGLAEKYGLSEEETEAEFNGEGEENVQSLEEEQAETDSTPEYKGATEEEVLATEITDEEIEEFVYGGSFVEYVSDKTGETLEPCLIDDQRPIYKDHRVMFWKWNTNDYTTKKEYWALTDYVVRYLKANEFKVKEKKSHKNQYGYWINNYGVALNPIVVELPSVRKGYANFSYAEFWQDDEGNWRASGSASHGTGGATMSLRNQTFNSKSEAIRAIIDALTKYNQAHAEDKSPEIRDVRNLIKHLTNVTLHDALVDEGVIKENPNYSQTELFPQRTKKASSKQKKPAAKKTQPKKVEQPTAKTGNTYGAQNKVVTADKYEELKRQMRAKLNQLNAGFDPELFVIGAQMAAYHVEAGARKFVDFAKRMIEDCGDAVRPYLKAIYNGARDLPGMEEFKPQMDSAADVDAIDVNDIQLEETPVENAVETEEEQPDEQKTEDEEVDVELERLSDKFNDLINYLDETYWDTGDHAELSFNRMVEIYGEDFADKYEYDYDNENKRYVIVRKDEEERPTKETSAVNEVDVNGLMGAVSDMYRGKRSEVKLSDFATPVRAEQQPAAETNAENLRPIEKFASENISYFNDEGLTDEDKKRAKDMFDSIWNGPGTNRDVKKHEDIDERICVYYNPGKSDTKFLIDHGNHISFMDNDEIYMLDFDDAAGNKSPKIVATRFKEIKKSSKAETTNVASETETVGEVSPYTHTKTGEQMYIVRLIGERLSSDEFKKLKSRAREFGGHYSSYGNAKGFLFKTEDDANKFNTITTTDNEEQTDEQTAAATTAVVSQAADVAEQAQSLAEAETRPDAGAANEAIAKIDEQLDKVNEQLALLGYYEADASDESQFNESMGYMKTAEKKAVKDADNLAKKLAKDLGIEVGRKQLAKANLAPAGGDVSFRIPLNEGRELYVNIGLQPTGYVPGYGYQDDLEVNTPGLGRAMAIMYRIEQPTASGSERYGTNMFEPYNVSYQDFLRDIRRVAKAYLPEAPAETAKPTGPVDVLQVAKEQAEKAKKAGKSDKKDVNSQKNGNDLMGDLFSDLYDSESDTADDEVNTKTPENVKPTEVNGYKIGDKVLYTPISGKRQTQEATIYDFEYDGRPVLDTGMAPVIYEITDWENIKPIITSDNGTEGNDEVRTEGLSADDTGSGQREGDSEGGMVSEPQQEAGGTDGGGVQGSEPATGTGRPVRRVPRLSGRNKNNNRISKGQVVYPTTPVARFNANIEAIRLMRELQDKGKQATKQQMEVLRKFTGWGGLGGYFNNEYSPEYHQLKALLSDEEINAAKLSINTAYYTPVEIIDSMWAVAEKLGFEGGTILEGSAGIGSILASMPKGISDASEITAVELDSTTGGILQLLYPDANVLIKGFQEADIPNNSVDLAITNVPFGNINVYDSKEKDLSRKFGGKIHDFCIAKNIRKLREGGIGIFISTRGTLDASSKNLRQWIVNEADTDVIGAFRLNNQTFEGTKATSDIIVVRKRVNGVPYKDAINVTDTEITRREEFKTGQREWDRKQGRWVDETSNAAMEINSYFVEHPENMGGVMGFGFEHDDTYRPGSSALWPSDKIDQQKRLNKWAKSFEKIPMTVEQFKDWLNNAKNELAGIEQIEGVTKEGQLIVNSKGDICVSRSKKAVPLDVNNQKIKGKYTKAQCLADYDALKQAINDTLRYEQTHETDEGLKPLLAKLNKAYDTFVKKYGYLHKNVSISFLRNDVDFASTAACEDYKESKDVNGKVIVKVKKNDLFNERVINAERIPTPSTVKDGVIVSMNKFGRIDIPFIAQALNKDEEDVRNEILDSGLGFENPETSNVEVEYEYLSGNVREKLEYAKEHNTDGRYDKNVKELEKVIPADIPAHLIEFTLGSDWLPGELYTGYAMEKFGANDKFRTVYIGGRWTLGNDTWEMNLNTEQNRSAGVRSEELRMEKTGVELMLAAMNNQTVVFSRVVKDFDGTQHTETDQAATQAASTKIADMRDEFKEWSRKRMLDDTDLAQRVAKIYNDTFNAFKPKFISDMFVPDRFDGQMLKRADGKPFSMRPHQAKAVIRATTEPLMMAHEVGSGKTFTLIATAMEMRRLGTAKKPMIVVQNATLGQFVSSAKELYPSAKVLTISESDRTVEGRSAFYAKIKYNDWDIIIVPQSVFEMMPDSEERQRDFIQEKIDEKMYVLEQARQNGDQNIVRDLQKELEDLEYERDFGEKPKKNKKKDSKREAEAQENTKVKIKKQLDRRTDEVSDFDEMGIDALLVDEAHAYKHLGFSTAMTRGVKGVDPSGSKRAAGVYLKTRAVFDKVGWRNVVFATGTPISNTAAEIWTFMKYLMPADTMRQYHIFYFDDFVRNFGAITQNLEFGTSGKFRETNRFSSYSNLPELVRIWWATTDVVLSKDAAAGKNADGTTKKLGDELPVIEDWTDDKGQKHENQARDIYLPQSPSLVEIMKAIRAKLQEFENMPGKLKKQYSYIPITMYGLAKQAAIDPRLVDRNAPDEPLSKTNKVVEETLKALEDSKKYKGTAALFSDNFRRWEYTPDGKRVEGFNLFEEIKRKLIEAGVPEDQIVIMKSGMNTAAKEKIFARVNAGDVRVIMGTTATLGTGVNIQERLHFLAHIDAPNRPMDYTQRNGRILRQGNLHKEWGIPVRLVRFGVEDSLDVTAYQRLATKSKFINSVMDGKTLLDNSMENRVLEEEDEGEFDNPVAILSGSEYALLKSAAERELRKLKNKKEQYRQDQIYIERTLKANESKIKALKENLADNKQTLSTIKSQFPDGKVKKVVIEGVPVKGAEQITAAIKDKITEPIREIIAYNRTRYAFKEGERNFTIQLDNVPISVRIEVVAKEVFSYTTGMVEREMRTNVTLNSPEIGIEDMHFPGGYSNIKNVIETLETKILSGQYHQDAIASNESTIARLENDDELMMRRRGKPFEDEEKLKEQEKTVEDLTEKMKKEMEEKEAKYAQMAGSETSTFNIEDIELEDEPEGDDATHNREVADDNAPRLDTSDPIVVAQAVSSVRRLAERLGLEVHVIDDDSNNAKGSYTEGTNYVTINLANLESIDDAVETLLHEGVAHFGLRKLLGEQGMIDFVNDVLEKASPAIRNKIDAMAAEKGWTLEYAAEEYIAELAQKTDYTKQERTFWRKVLQFFRDMIDKVTHRQNRISDDTIREMLIASYENLEEGADFENALLDNNNVRFVFDNPLLSNSVDQINHYSIRRKPAPKKTGIGYKVFYRGKDGKLYPPMVANPNGEDTPVGVWLDADAAPVAGKSKTGRPQVKAGGKGTQGGSGTLAYRPGWHLGEIPYALQFNRNNPQTGEKDLFPKDFVWAEVEYAADKNYQREAEAEGINSNGKYQHSLAGLKQVPEDGYYTYRTNPNPATDPWIITGSMKVNRVLTRDEVDDIVRKAGRSPQAVEGDAVNNSQDAEYQKAYEAGDTEKAQAMVDEAAKRAGYSVRAYHGSPVKGITTFDVEKAGEHTNAYDERAIWFTPRKDFAEDFAHEFLPGSTSFTVKLGKRGEVYNAALKMNNPLDMRKPLPEDVKQMLLDGRYRFLDAPTKEQAAAFFEDIEKLEKIGNHQLIKMYIDFDRLRSMGYDGIIANLYPYKMAAEDESKAGVEYGVLSPEQIKLANPFTFDDNGKLIPLSERFNEQSNDIRNRVAESAESIEANDILDRYENQDGSKEYPYMTERDLVEAVEGSELMDNDEISALVNMYYDLDEEDRAEGRRDFAGGEMEDLVNDELIPALRAIASSENIADNSINSQDLFTSLWSKENGYDYDKITELAERVISGRTEMAFIKPEFRRAVRTIPQAAIAIITRRGSSADGREIPSNKETEQAVIEWAKKEGYLIDEAGLDALVGDDYQFRTGGEADVFIKKTNGSVIKVYNQPDIPRFVGAKRNAEITKFNAAVPGSELDVIGVMDNNGVPAIVAQQKYISGHTLENLNKRVWDYANELEAKYDIILTPRSQSHDALGVDFEYDDLNEQNIIISDKTGEPVIIDCWIDNNISVSALYDRSAKESFVDVRKREGVSVESAAQSGVGYTNSIQGKRDAVTETAQKCGIDVEFRPSSEMMLNGKPLAGRWDNGRMYICVEHCRDTNDAVRTVLHEGVGHNGLRRLIGNENMTQFCLDVFKRLPSDARRRIARAAVYKYGGNTAEAVEEYLAKRAEELDYENTDYERNFWDRVRGLLRKALAKVGINVTLSDRDVRWIMWQSYNANKQGDLLNQAKRQVVANKLGFTLRQQSEKDGAIQIVRNRRADNELSAANIYNREVANWASRLHETWVDKDEAVHKLVEAVEKAYGKKAEAFEDVRLALNQQSSKGLAAIEHYEHRYFEPMKAAIKQLMDDKGCSLADVERYVMLKHGLERNEIFAKRDAKEYYQNLHDRAVKEITDSSISPNEKKERIAKEDAKLEKHFNDIDAGFDRKYRELRKEDYGGLTALYSEYDTILPFDPELETNEEYQARVLNSRHPKFTYIDNDGNVQVDMEATETAAEQEVAAFEDGYNEDVEELWKRVNAATKATLKHQYDANMMSREQYMKVRDMFQFYVPLRGFADNTAEDMYDYYNSDQRGNFAPPLMKAKGRKTESESPFGYIGAMASSGIAADMKNETKLALYYFISNRDNNDLVKISDLWYVKTGEDEYGRSMFSPAYYPYNEDMTTEEAKKAYEDWEKSMEKAAKNGEAFRGTSKLNLKNSVIHIDRKNEPSHIIRFKVGGRDKMMIINGNPRAAQAINNELNVEMSSDYQKFFGKILRYFSGINTSYNPEFWLSNAQRDILFALMSVNAKEDAEYNRVFRKNLKSVLGTVIPQKKDNKTGVYSLKRKLEEGTLGNSEVEQLYREFVENGGVTGYTTLKNNEEWEQELRKYTGEDLVKMNAIKKGFEAIQKYGEAVEQMTRFAAYMTSRQQGKQIKDAVNDAKELTVNFNRKGSGKAISFKEADKLRTKDGKKLNPFQKALVVGASWLPVYGRRFIMFFNASVQGLNAMYKLFKKNPTKMGLWTAGYAALGVIQALIHAWLDDDDDYLDIPDYERRNNLLLGGKGVYFKWALPQEARIFYAMGDMAVNHALGREPHRSMLSEIAASVSDIAPLNPAGGVAALTPSALNPLFEVLLNEDYKGSKIYNDLRYLSDEEKKRTPAYQKAYQSTGRPYMLISQFANWATGGDYADAGWLNINPAAVEHLVQGATGGAGTTLGKFYRGTIGQALGEDFSVRNTPFLSRILTVNDERYRNAHTTELFDYYKAEAEHTKKRINTYRKNSDDDRLDKILDSKDYDIMQIYESYRHLMQYYNDELKATTDRKERKELMREQDAVRKEMIKEISEIDK